MQTWIIRQHPLSQSSMYEPHNFWSLADQIQYFWKTCSANVRKGQQKQFTGESAAQEANILSMGTLVLQI